MESYRFKVNLGGMIEILSDHLYSSPDVFIRELLQNGADAITAKLKLFPESRGKITIEVKNEESIIFSDNGLGLTEDEIHQFLAIIGESSKRDIESGRIKTDYIGRFGIGLLSCFMVSNEICMITRSCKDENAKVLEWCGKPDGTYTIKELDASEMDGSGTKVLLKVKKGMEMYYTAEYVEKLVKYYGLLLPNPIVIVENGAEHRVNSIELPWESAETDKDELMDFGQQMFKEAFFDCLTFHSEDGNVSGVAFIKNYSVLPSGKSNHMIYLKNMLLTEKGEGLIPDWAVFTRCIVNATDLRPTASREGFYSDDVLVKARESIENSMIDYIVDLAENHASRFKRFFRLHSLTLMSLALSDRKLFKTLINYFEFDTTRGVLTGYDLINSDDVLVYAPTREKYNQISQLFYAQDKLLINVSYVHSLELLDALGAMFDRVVCAVEDFDVENLMNEISIDEQDDTFDFIRSANRILSGCDCKADVKRFSPDNLPVFYFLDEDAVMSRQIKESMEYSNQMFMGILSSFVDEYESVATLYFNLNCPMIQRLVQEKDESRLRSFVELLYVQALQIGGFVMHKHEYAMLNRNIMTLIENNLGTT